MKRVRRVLIRGIKMKRKKVRRMEKKMKKK